MDMDSVALELAEPSGLFQTEPSNFGDQGSELPRFRVVGKQFRSGDFEKPAVQPQRSIHQAVLHAGVAVQIIQAEQDVFLGDSLRKRLR